MGRSQFMLLGPFRGVSNRAIALCEGQEYRLGRSSDCEIVVEDLSVSREHARLTVRGRSVVVEDFGSRNGTYVENRRITGESEVRVGQRIRVGDVVLLVAKPTVEKPSSLSRISTEMRLPSESTPTGVSMMESCLTPARRRVYEMLRQGMSEREIALHLKISKNTVHHHISAVFRTFGVHSQKELLVLVRVLPSDNTTEWERRR